MNIITGCLAATSGEVKIDGYDIFEQPKEAKKRVGYLPELPPLYTDQTEREYLRFVARAKGLKRADIPGEIDRVITETHTEEVADKLIKHLSKGYRQRVGIAQALLGNPDIIILDEPTVGLDPAQIIEIRELIKQLGETHTVILSSHILSEIEAICSQVLIIHKGQLVAFDKLENLSKTLSTGNTIELCVEMSGDETIAFLSGMEGITSVTLHPENAEEGTCCATLSVGDADPKILCRKIYAACVKAGKVLVQLNPVQATLEDIFMEITSDRRTLPPLTEDASETADGSTSETKDTSDTTSEKNAEVTNENTSETPDEADGKGADET